MAKTSQRDGPRPSDPDILPEGDGLLNSGVREAHRVRKKPLFNLTSFCCTILLDALVAYCYHVWAPRLGIDRPSSVQIVGMVIGFAVITIACYVFVAQLGDGEGT